MSTRGNAIMATSDELNSSGGGAGGLGVWLRRLFLFGAPALGLLAYFMLPAASYDEAGKLIGGLSHAARATAGVAVVMALWWLSEALPLEAVSLIPLAVFPVLGIMTIGETARPYAQEIIFLFLGGMLLGQAVERWGLHRRAALVVVNAVGASPGRLVAGLLIATTFVSMWVSNTAATVMMLPIATSVATLVGVELERMRRAASGGTLHGLATPSNPKTPSVLEDSATSPAGAEEDASAEGDDGATSETVLNSDRRHEAAADRKALDNLSVSLILAVAFGASIGGVGTLIGTPPMAQMAGFIKTTYGHGMTFLEWMKIGVPVLVVFVAVCWLSLAKVCFPVRLGAMPGVRRLISEELSGLGRMNRGERATLIVFAAAALLWVAAPLVGAWVKEMPPEQSLRNTLLFTTRLSDAGIAMAAALALFMIPAGDKRSGERRRPVLTWREASRCPWGILILFGGGLSLAEAVKTTGLDQFIAGQFTGMEHVPVLAVMFAMAAVCVFLTELTSNTALVAAMLPLCSALAVKLEAPPEALIMTATLSASLGFMLPMGTAPNALAYATGRVTMRQMAKAGLLLDVLTVLLVPLVVWSAMKAGLLVELGR